MAQKETTKKQKSHNKREAAKLDRTSGGRSDSDVELCFDISLPFFFLFFYHDSRANMQTIWTVCFQSHGPEVQENQLVCPGIS